MVDRGKGFVALTSKRQEAKLGMTSLDLLASDKLSDHWKIAGRKSGTENSCICLLGTEIRCRFLSCWVELQAWLRTLPQPQLVDDGYERWSNPALIVVYLPRVTKETAILIKKMRF